MEIKQHDIEKEVYRAIDAPRGLSREVKQAIIEEIEKRLIPIYAKLKEHDRRITKLESERYTELARQQAEAFYNAPLFNNN